MDDSRIHIRRGGVADAAALAAFAEHTFAETYAADNRPEDMRAHMESSFTVARQSKELADPDVVTLLTYVGERRVGERLADETLVAYTQIRRNAPPPCVTQQYPIEIHRFYVDRPAHGQGIAQHLMAAAFASARALGGQHLWLSVWERNPRAVAFYKKVGFMDVGSTDFFVGPDRQKDRVLVAALHRTSK